MPRITGHQPISGLGCLGQKKKDLTHAQLAPGKVGDFAPAKGVAGVESHGSVREASPKMCAGMKGALPTIRSNRLKT